MPLAHKLRSLLRQPYGSFMLLWMFVGTEADRRSLQKKRGSRMMAVAFQQWYPFSSGEGMAAVKLIFHLGLSSMVGGAARPGL
ncbi:unnamed protein product [Calypogeia fissa]